MSPLNGCHFWTSSFLLSWRKSYRYQYWLSCIDQLLPFWYGKGIFIVLLFFSFVKMLYAQHNYSLGRSSFPFLCVCSFTSTDAFMLNKCLILVIAYRIFLHSTPPYRYGEALPCFTYHPNFLFLKHRSGFSDFFTK